MHDRASVWTLVLQTLQLHFHSHDVILCDGQCSLSEELQWFLTAYRVSFFLACYSMPYFIWFTSSFPTLFTLYTVYYNQFEIRCIHSFLCLLLSLFPESGILFPFWKSDSLFKVQTKGQLILLNVPSHSSWISFFLKKKVFKLFIEV